MNKLSILVIMTLIFALGATAQTTKKDTKIFGEVIDIQSFIAYGMKADNPDRQAMAENSIKAGNPLGVLEKGTGKIYLVTTSQPNIKVGDALKEYFGVKVFVVGKVYKKGGLQMIIMSDIGRTN